MKESRNQGGMWIDVPTNLLLLYSWGGVTFIGAGGEDEEYNYSMPLLIFLFNYMYSRRNPSKDFFPI